MSGYIDKFNLSGQDIPIRDSDAQEKIADLSSKKNEMMNSISDSSKNAQGMMGGIKNQFDSFVDTNVLLNLKTLTKTVKTTERYVHEDFELSANPDTVYCISFGDIDNKISNLLAVAVFQDSNGSQLSSTNINHSYSELTSPSGTEKMILQVYFVLNVFPSAITEITYHDIVVTERTSVPTYELKQDVADKIRIHKKQALFLDSSVYVDGDYTKAIASGTRFQSSVIRVDHIPEKKVFSFGIDDYSGALDAQVAQIDVYNSNDTSIYSGAVSKSGLSSGNHVFATPPGASYLTITLWFSTTTIAQSNITVTFKGVKLFETKAERFWVNANENNHIYCIGDSLTMGAGDGSASYPAVLQSLLPDYSITNYGIGGESSETICARMCGFMVEPFTIPANTSAVTVEIKSLFGGTILPLLQSNAYSKAGINDIYIDGIRGTLSVNAGTQVYSFTRAYSGTAHEVTRPTFVYTDAMLSNKWNAIALLWIGTNDIYAGVDDTIEYKDMSYTISRVNQIIKQLKTDRFFVLGLTIVNRPTNEKLRENVQEFNRIAKLEYGSNFIDLASYLIQYGLEDAGITPTAQDTEDINAGKIPSSLMSDNTHFNASGYAVVANYVYKKGKEMGYWN